MDHHRFMQPVAAGNEVEAARVGNPPSDYVLRTDTGELIPETSRADLWTRLFLVGVEDIRWPRGYPIIEPCYQQATVGAIENCWLTVARDKAATNFAGCRTPTPDAGVPGTEQPEGIFVEVEERDMGELSRVLAALQGHGARIAQAYSMLRGGLLIHAVVERSAYWSLGKDLEGVAWVRPVELDLADDRMPVSFWDSRWRDVGTLAVWINPAPNGRFGPESGWT